MEYDSVEWNSITLSDACKLDRIQQKFIALFLHPFFAVTWITTGVMFYITWNYTPLVLVGVTWKYFFLTDVFHDSKYCPTLLEVDRNGLVGMETRNGLDGPGIGGQIFQTGPVAHPASCIMGTGSFPGVKQPEPPTPSTAEVKQRVELYLYSPSGSSLSVLVWTLPFWKLLAYACQIEILETLACWMLTLKAESFLPLNALRRKMPSAVIPICSLDVRSRLLRCCWTCTLINEKFKNE